MKRKILLAAVVLGVGGLSARYSASRPAVQAPLSCRFSEGEELSFRITSVSSASGQSQSGRREIRAAMDWKVKAQHGGEWTVIAALSGIELDGDDTPHRRVSLAQPFAFSVGADCRFRQVRFEPSSDVSARKEVESLLRAAEVIVPTLPLTEWVARHHDSLGDFDAQYHRAASSAGLFLQRERLRYDAATLPMLPERLGGGLHLSILASKAELTLDPQGRWIREASEHTRLRIARGSQPLSEVESSIHLYRDAESRPNASALASVDLSRLSASATEVKRATGEVALPPPPDAALAALDLRGAMTDFTQRLTSTPDGVYQAAMRLASYLSTHPEAITELLAQLESGAIAAKLQPHIFLALERTGTPAAERALAAALSNRALGAMNRMRAAAALQDIPRPSMATAQTLLAQARSSAGGPDDRQVADSALLALGALEHRVAKQQPEAAQLVRHELSDRLRTQRRPEELNVTLDAIGNSGDKDLAGFLAPYSRDSAVETRVHAARAYRRMDLQTLEPALTEWLGRESDGQVGRAIGQSLAEKLREQAQAPSAETVSMVAARLPRESDAGARAAFVSVLGLAAQAQPAAKQALVQQFQRETVVAIKVLIGRYVTADDLR